MSVESPEEENKLGAKAVIVIAPLPLSIMAAQQDLEFSACSKWNNSAEKSDTEMKVILCLLGVSFWYYLLCGRFCFLFLVGYFFWFGICFFLVWLGFVACMCGFGGGFFSCCFVFFFFFFFLNIYC